MSNAPARPSAEGKVDDIQPEPPIERPVVEPVLVASRQAGQDVLHTERWSGWDSRRSEIVSQ